MTIPYNKFRCIRVKAFLLYIFCIFNFMSYIAHLTNVIFCQNRLDNNILYYLSYKYNKEKHMSYLVWKSFSMM